MMRMSVPLSSRWVAKLCRSVCTVTRLPRPDAAHADRQAACSTVALIDVEDRTRETASARVAPVANRNEQLRRQLSLALLDADDHPAAVDVSDLEARGFGSTQPGGIGRSQGGIRLQARYRFEEAHDFIGS